MKTLITTLLILRKNDKLILAKKKRGFGEGKINGCGGKCQPDETIEEAMKREAYEELNITPTNAKKYGIVDFIEYVKGELTHVNMHIFYATEYEGTPTETDEMTPCFVDIDNIPFDKMFPDDKYWMHLLLQEKQFVGKFEFDENFNVISHFVEECTLTD